jgi:hypothetical protein
MKQQINEIQKLQKMAGILKENISEAPKSSKDDYYNMVKIMQSLRGPSNFEKWRKVSNKVDSIKDKLSNKEIIELIKESGISLNGIKKGLITAFRDEPFSDRRDVNSAIAAIKNAASIEQMGTEIEDSSGGSFDERDFYLLVIDLIEQGTIK